MERITVKFFASLREQLGCSELKIEAGGLGCALDVWNRVSNKSLPANCLIAINQEYAEAKSAVQAGDEVAFFPPVTGG